MRKAGWVTGSGVVLAVVLFFAVNILANTALTSTRVDLTEGRLFTLSQGTRNVLAALDEPVTLRLFLTRDVAMLLPGVASHANRVRELLAEYERAAGGALEVRLIDPEPFSEEEDRAVGYGLQGVPLGDGGSVLYFGLVGTNSIDDEEVIAFFALEREEFLEYDLTKLIHQLGNPKQPVVGLMSSLPMDGFSGGMPPMGAIPQPWLVLEQMRQLFEVRTVELTASRIESDIDVLMVVHPKELSDATLYAIDQFVLRGGRAILFVDPHAESEQGVSPLGPMGAAGASDLNRLLRHWGVELVEGKVVSDLPIATKIRVQREGRNLVLDYPVWLDIQTAQMDAADVVTARLGNLLLATPGALRTLDDAETRVAPLIHSTPDAMLIDGAQLGFDADPRDLLRNYQPGGEMLVLAARVTGTVETLFADGAPSAEQAGAAQQAPETPGADAQTAASHLARSTEPINVIVVADTDMLQDRYWVQVQELLGTRIALPSAANGSFVVNALDNLTGSNDLISVRNRGSSRRPFTMVEALQRDAELRFREKEQELLGQLQATEQRLLELDRDKQDDAVILSSEQRAEIDRFRREKVRIRTELRDVRHALHQDIERLESWVKFINIGMVPLLIGVGGALVSVAAGRRRRTARPAQR